jgi:integrase
VKRNAHKPEYEKNLKKLSKESRQFLVISIGVSGRVLSNFGDDVWDLSPYISARNKSACDKKIDFSSIQFADGSRLTDTRHAVLLAGAKAFLYVRMSINGTRTGKPLSGISITNMWRIICSLLRWMVGAGYGRFVDLTSEACLVYIEYSKNRTTWEYTTGGRKGRQMSGNVLHRYFSCIEEMWYFRDHLEDTLMQHPWPGRSLASLVGVKNSCAFRNAKTEQIPDRLMSKLMQGALRYVVDGYGEQLLACREARENGKYIKDHLSRLGLKNWPAVKEEITRLHTACYVLVAGLSGMRDGEIASLETNCYYEHDGWDGATYGWLKGYTSKLEVDPKPVEWMVPPVVAKSVELVIRISAPIRDELDKRIRIIENKLRDNCYLNTALRQKDEEALTEMKKQYPGLFIVKQYQAGRIGIPCHATMHLRFKNFTNHLNLHVQASDLAQVLDREKIKEGDVWPLSPHQFRRTFARYVARCILGDVRYLREHFKHWSLDMTLGYAWGDEDWIDATLIEEILTERRELQDDIVWGWIDVKTNQHLAATGGKTIEKCRGSSLAMVATDPRAVARQLSQGYFLRGLGHSWCTEKECRGKGIYSVTECRDCENRVIDESHIPMWYGIRDQQIELMMLDDCGDPIWQGALESLRYAEQILTDLGEKVVPYPAPPKPSERRLNV